MSSFNIEMVWLLTLVVVITLLTICTLIVVVLLWRRLPTGDLATAVTLQSELLEKGLARLEQVLREEIGRNREEFLASARRDREELTAAFTGFSQQTRDLLLKLRETLDQAGQAL
jgi:hypothetical protein